MEQVKFYMYNITHAPLPNWDVIVKSFFSKMKSDSELAMPWVKYNEKSFWFSRSAWSIYIIARFRMQVTNKKKITIWLPAYFCNESISPLRNLNVVLFFYPILKSGHPDIVACEKMLSENTPDIVAIVDYFGKQSISVDLCKLASKNAAWLIEDSAHRLQPERDDHQYSDFVLYSPHKFLAIPDGGILIIRSNGPGGISSELLAKYEFDLLYKSILNKGKPSGKIIIIWLIKRILQKLGLRSRQINLQHEDEVTVMSSKVLPHPRMTGLAKKLLGTTLSELEENAIIRKDNQSAWVSELKAKNIITESVIPICENFTPYLAGFSTSSSEEADKIYTLLQQARIPVTTWPDLPPEVLSDTETQKIAIDMRKTRFFLPVHHSVNIAAIQSHLSSI